MESFSVVPRTYVPITINKKNKNEGGEGERIEYGFLKGTGDFSITNIKQLSSIHLVEEKDEKIPDKIQGNYTEDYDITYVDRIIKKKLRKEKYGYLEELKKQLVRLNDQIMMPQTYITRANTLDLIESKKKEIAQIESGSKIFVYEERTKDLLSQYKKLAKNVKVISLDEEEKYVDLDPETRNRIYLIEKYLEIAKGYIDIDVIRINTRPSDICTGCGISLANVATNMDGTMRCPDPECQTEHNVIIMAKLAKDSSRINIVGSNDDESAQNFTKAFIRYQGLQQDKPLDSIYVKLDEYFSKNNRPIGDEIKKLPLNDRGRRGDTNHRMLWDALSQIGHSEHYKDTNLIGHNYWGWTLPKVMHLKDKILDQYNKTQKIYYQIHPEERGRNSSLGTQYRLWRHLELAGHECYRDEFKIAENTDSDRIHDKLWRLMCEGCNDPEIYYIP